MGKSALLALRRMITIASEDRHIVDSSYREYGLLAL
jgi:hypothetical protein